MDKQPKRAAGVVLRKGFVGTAQAVASGIWLAGVGAVGRFGQENLRLIDDAVGKGRSLQGKLSSALTEGMVTATARAGMQMEKIEKVFQKRVARSIGHLGVASKKDFDAIAKRVAELTARVNALGAARETARIRATAE